MPYNSKGIIRAESCLRIEMKYFTKQGIFKQNENKILIFNDKIRVSVILNEGRKYLLLQYTLKNNTTLKTTDYEYKVYIAERVSNLGIGKVYYFECPFNKRLCRVLYMAYGSTMFKSRFSYCQRIYYNIQTMSKREYPLTRILKLQKEINRLKKSRMKQSYKGRITKTFKRYGRLINHYDKFEYLNYNYLMIGLNKLKNKY